MNFLPPIHGVDAPRLLGEPLQQLRVGGVVRPHAVAERAEHDVLVVAEDDARADLAEASRSHRWRSGTGRSRRPAQSSFVDVAHALDGDVQRLNVAVDVGDDPEAHRLLPYSGKIEVTTSSMER